MTTVCLMLPLILSFIVPGINALFHRCPPRDGSFNDFYSHCTCTKSREQYQVDVICQDITTDEIFSQCLTRLRNYTIDSLTLRRSGVLTLSSTPFRKLNIHRLFFEEVIFIAVDIFRAFRGLEFTLEEMHFVRCNVTLWSWGDGRQFIYLESVRFEDTALPEVLTKEGVFKYFPNKIRTLKINGCSVRRLGVVALKKFPHLEHIELERNKLSSIQRSIFSPTMRRLKSISLSGNPLRSIAEDTFVNMSRLEILTLSNTRLASLRNETFFPVWDQLEEIRFNNIRLNCDCDAKWMFNVPEFKVFHAPYCNSHRKLLDQLDLRERNQLCQQ